jgi:hypothetical protein
MHRVAWHKVPVLSLTLMIACGDSTGATAGSAGSTGGGSTGQATTGQTTSTTGATTVDTTGGSQSGTGTTTGEPTTTSPTSSDGTTTTTTGSTGPSTTTTDTTGSTGAVSAGSSGGSTGPACPPGQTECAGECVDLETDPDHCGGCDAPCLDGQLCQAGGCLDLVCVPNSMASCYSGPPQTAGVGLCKEGVHVCDAEGDGFGPCEGEVTPKPEDCATPGDDDCDGKVNPNCLLPSCKAIKDAAPASKDGPYTIDVDGDDGPLPPIDVLCDMTLDGGGWTRFNWLHGDYVAGQDPLGQTLFECKLDDPQCRGRIPAGIVVTDLMVKDITDKVHAMWKFNNTTVSKAVLAALQNKTEACLLNQGAFQPYFSNSAEAYCGNGQEGGCDSFYYTSGACQAVGNWGVHWDGDNHWCAAAFKIGATKAGCGNHGDQGFLNECACDDEKGELYYR